MQKEPRIGHGYDVHRLVEGRQLILGGVVIPFERGLLGHSDADVLVHAIMDGICGALCLGDIGQLFPDTDAAYKDISSMKLLKQVVMRMNAAGYRVGNVDAVVCCERPKLAPYIVEMRRRLAALLRVAPDCVSVKATTTEKLGFVGREEGIAAHAVVLLFPRIAAE